VILSARLSLPKICRQADPYGVRQTSGASGLGLPRSSTRLISVPGAPSAARCNPGRSLPSPLREASHQESTSKSRRSRLYLVDPELLPDENMST